MGNERLVKTVQRDVERHCNERRARMTLMGLKSLLSRPPEDDVVIGEPALPLVPLTEEREREFEATRDRLAADLADLRDRVDAANSATEDGSSTGAEPWVVDILQEAVVPPANSVAQADQSSSHTAPAPDSLATP